MGGRQKTVDLALEQATTGERAAVQVKSRANQKVLDAYVARFDEMGTFNRMFFVCHSPAGTLKAPDRPDIHVWAGRDFAATVLRLGLHDWVLEKLA